MPKPHPSGIVGIGGSLSSENLYNSYKRGIFPWYSEGEPICWYNPDPRFVLFLKDYKVPKGLNSIKKSGKFNVTVNTVFPQVIKACKEIERKDQDGTWITKEMEEAYLDLYSKGHVLCLEVWDKKSLVGGLYGVKLGSRFSGESMFSKVSNASKLAFDYLVDYLRAEGGHLIDCQIHSDHLARIGAKEISREEFQKIWDSPT